MGLLSFAVYIPLFSWLIISPAVFVWWFFHPHARDRFFKSHDKIVMAIYIGAFFSFILILGQGIEKLFLFIPGDWGGYDEDGNFVTTRSSIAHGLALLTSFFFFHVFDKFEKLRDENCRLSIIVEVEKRKRALRDSCLDSLIEKRREVETQLNDLREKSYEIEFSSENESEIQILIEMLEELECRIGETEHRVNPNSNKQRPSGELMVDYPKRYGKKNIKLKN